MNNSAGGNGQDQDESPSDNMTDDIKLLIYTRSYRIVKFDENDYILEEGALLSGKYCEEM